jgi:hypothetical protein
MMQRSAARNRTAASTELPVAIVGRRFFATPDYVVGIIRR